MKLTEYKVFQVKENIFKIAYQFIKDFTSHIFQKI